MINSTAPFAPLPESFTEIVEDIRKTGNEYTIIENGRPVAAMVDYKTHESLWETVNILSDPDTMRAIEQAEEDIAAGRVINLEG